MSNQTLKVQGIIEVQLPFNPTTDLVRGRISFTDSLNKSLASLRVFGTTQPRLIMDSVNLANGIAFRASTSQGTFSEGGKGEYYGLEVLNTGITTTNIAIRANPPSVKESDGYGNAILTASRSENTNPTVGISTYIAKFFQDIFKDQEAIHLAVGSSYSTHYVFGFRRITTGNADVGYIGSKTSTNDNTLPTYNLLFYKTGDVEIPTKLKATTVEATNWIGLPAVVVPSAQLLPLTLNSTDGHVGINTTSPTEALDVQGNIKASGFITGQLTSGAQPGITGVGVLGGLDVTGDADFASGVTVAHDLSVSGAVMASEAHVLGDLSAANATVSQVLSVMGSIQAPEAHILGTVTADRITATHYDNLPVQSLTPITLDVINKRVGIDKATPQEALDVVGNIHATGSVFGTQLLGDDLMVNDITTSTINAGTYFNLPPADVSPITLDKVNNRVGINQSTPTATLHIVGNVISGSIEAAGTITTNNVTCFSTLDANIVKGNTAEVATTLTAGNYTTDRQSFRVQNNGKVDINWLKTDFPPYQLNVDGNAQVTDQVKCTKLALGLSTASNVFYSAGTPEGVQIAPVGSLWMRKDGTSGTTLYTKVSGTGNTGWQTVGGGSVVPAPVRKSSFRSTSLSLSATVNTIANCNVIALESGTWIVTACVGISSATAEVCVMEYGFSTSNLTMNHDPAGGYSLETLSIPNDISRSVVRKGSFSINVKLDAGTNIYLNARKVFGSTAVIVLSASICGMQAIRIGD